MSNLNNMTLQKMKVLQQVHEAMKARQARIKESVKLSIINTRNIVSKHNNEEGENGDHDDTVDGVALVS